MKPKMTWLLQMCQSNSISYHSGPVWHVSRTSVVLNQVGPTITSWEGLVFRITGRYMGITWWRHQLETFFALLALCEGNPPVTDGFLSQRPFFFDLRLNKQLSKQSRPWFKTLLRHCNEVEVEVEHSETITSGFPHSPHTKGQQYRVPIVSLLLAWVILWRNSRVTCAMRRHVKRGARVTSL